MDQSKTTNRRWVVCTALLCVLGRVTIAGAQFDDALPGPDQVFPSDKQPADGGFDIPGLFPNQKPNTSEAAVEVSVVPASRRVAQGADLMVAIVLDHAPGFHVHPNKIVLPDGADAQGLIATEIAVVGGDETVLTPYVNLIKWPETHDIMVEFFATPEPVPYGVYKGKAVAYLPVTVAADAPLGEATLTLLIKLQACNDTECLFPAEIKRELTVTVMTVAELAKTRGDDKVDEELFEGFPSDVWPRIRAGDTGPDLVEFELFGWDFEIDASGWGMALLLIVAAVGGFLLNLTPCVLPVIPIKIMGLSQSAGNRARCLLLGAVMFSGVVAFWLALGGVIAGSVHAAAQAVASNESATGGITSTNQLFQYPAFTIGVGVIIAVMAVGMCGLFAVRLPQFVYKLNPKHDSVVGSFGFGIMTAVLSTPCTAPFMGAAAAWAAGQHWFTTLVVFAAIGFGMALPYLVLAAFPALVERMPRTGPASELIKQVMGVLMLAAAAYFIGSGVSGLLQTPPDPPSKLFWWVVMGLAVAAGGWLAIRTFALTHSIGKRVVFGSLGLLMAFAGASAGISLTSPGPIEWTYYTPQRFDQAVKDGNIIVMDFTAEWCANCKTLEHTVLYTDKVVELTRQPGVIPMKVDLTGNNVEGNARLNALGRRAIPLLAVFDANGKVVWQNDFYTVNDVLSAVAEAQGNTATARNDGVGEVSGSGTGG